MDTAGSIAQLYSYPVRYVMRVLSRDTDRQSSYTCTPRLKGQLPAGLVPVSIEDEPSPESKASQQPPLLFVSWGDSIDEFLVIASKDGMATNVSALLPSPISTAKGTIVFNEWFNATQWTLVMRLAPQPPQTSGPRTALRRAASLGSILRARFARRGASGWVARILPRTCAKLSRPFS